MKYSRGGLCLLEVGRTAPKEVGFNLITSAERVVCTRSYLRARMFTSNARDENETAKRRSYDTTVVVTHYGCCLRVEGKEK